MSTPFDEESADLLDELRVPVFKMASGEITNCPFLEYVARKVQLVLLARRSLVPACDIPAGAQIERRMVAAKRPGTGLAASLLGQVIGRVAKRCIASQEALNWEVLD
jgi:sialic acid synthase SpsE